MEVVQVPADYVSALSLLDADWSPDQITRLFRCRAAMRRGRYSEWLLEPDRVRLRFARWLVQHGWLQP